jgi:hypothetical protein
VIFAPVPPGKRLVIEHVNVDVDSKQFGFSPVMVLFEDVTGGASAVLPAFLRTGTLYGSNEAVLIYVDAGQAPKLHTLGSSSGVTVNVATISGYLVDLTL